MLMPLRQINHQLRNDIRIRGKSAKIRKGKIITAVEGEAQSISGRRMRDGGTVEPSSRLVMGGITRYRTFHGESLIMKLLSAVDQLWTKFVAVMMRTRLGAGCVHVVYNLVIVAACDSSGMGRKDREMKRT